MGSPLMLRELGEFLLVKNSSSAKATVKDNRDLDIPTQKEMLAMFRCDEISAEIFKKFTELVTPLRLTLEKGVIVEKFGATANKAYHGSLADYDQPASRYHPEVATKKRIVLESKLYGELHALFLKQLQILSKVSILKVEILSSFRLPSVSLKSN